jgi:hypothetical protein
MSIMDSKMPWNLFSLLMPFHRRRIGVKLMAGELAEPMVAEDASALIPARCCENALGR